MATVGVCVGVFVIVGVWVDVLVIVGVCVGVNSNCKMAKRTLK